MNKEREKKTLCSVWKWQGKIHENENKKGKNIKKRFNLLETFQHTYGAQCASIMRYFVFVTFRFLRIIVIVSFGELRANFEG